MILVPVPVPEIVPSVTPTKEANAGVPAVIENRSGDPVVDGIVTENEVELVNTFAIGLIVPIVGKEFTATIAVTEFVQALFTPLATV